MTNLKELTTDAVCLVLSFQDTQILGMIRALKAPICEFVSLSDSTNKSLVAWANLLKGMYQAFGWCAVT